MKSKELKEKDIKELRVVAKDLKVVAQSFCMEVSIKKSSKTHLINKSKRDLAMVYTIIREKELSE